jgi:hypothetical protein
MGGGAVASAVDVPAEAGAVQDLRLIVVRSKEHLRIWNELMLRDHPQGHRPLVGRQLRYLIGSGHGWLGGLGVGAAALHLERRDEWIGWDWDRRREYLDRVVCLSRFLIREGVKCRNLASKVLGMFVRALPDDFQTVYGYRPWLVETFVDTTVFRGTCFRAANWQWAGQTKGRGRQDREKQFTQSLKDIYLYCLTPNMRAQMGLDPEVGAVAIGVGAGCSIDEWARKEFGGAQLGDKRLTRRLVAIAGTKATDPMKALTYSADGRHAEVKGYYRFIDNPDENAVNMDSVLASHRERTIKRMRSESVVLCVQDSTDLNYSTLLACEGLGFMGTNQSRVESQGLRLHSTLALTARGLPLGVLRGECLARKRTVNRTRLQRRRMPIEQKETARWLRSVQDCTELSRLLTGVRLINVMDREGDIFEVFQHWQKNPCIDLLVRASKDRCIEDGGKLFAHIRASAVQAHTQLTIHRRSARPKKGSKGSQKKQPAREAILELRWSKLSLKPPCYWPAARTGEPIAVWVVHAREINAPEGIKPVEWILLATIPVESAEDAVKCLGYYAQRWRIEDWHRVLKCACRVESAAAETTKRLERLIAIYMVIAWRIMLMIRLGREQPNLPPQILFSDFELQLLNQYAQTRSDVQPPATLWLAVLLVSRLGGYLDRKHDPPPGPKALWQGYTKLRLMCEGAAVIMGRAPP